MLTISKPFSVAVGIALVAGCHGPVEPRLLPVCEYPTTISVTSGLKPVFSWSPECRAGELIVDPISDVVDNWVIQGAGHTDGLVQPLRYGSSPDSTVTIVSPMPLVDYQQDRVRLLVADSTSPLYQTVGATLFKP